jgi:uncharacterized protein (TIGR03118 family)
MRMTHRWLVVLTLFVAFLDAVAAEKRAGFVETDLVVNKLVNGVPILTDKNGIVHIAQFFDQNLVNPWGIAASASSPFWLSDNGTGVSTLYNTVGRPQSLVVSIPTPGHPLGAGGAPTGIVFNIAAAQQAFKISGVTRTGTPITAAAIFLFATESGTILGWNPNVNPSGLDPAKAGTYAIIAIDKSAEGAVYKGLAIATDANTGTTFLYATNFNAATVEVYGAQFLPPSLAADAFTDRHAPKGYAPFNIAPLTVNGVPKLFVTYAVQDSEKHDDVAGESHGIVDTFSLDGDLFDRFAQHGQLNSPWGVTLAPPDFGDFAGDVLIGNFGNGHINVFDAMTGRFISKLRDSHGQAIVIDGLWALRVGNGGNGGNAKTVYFTAGPNEEADGLFGSLTPNQ